MYHGYQIWSEEPRPKRSALVGSNVIQGSGVNQRSIYFNLTYAHQNLVGRIHNESAGDKGLVGVNREQLGTGLATLRDNIQGITKPATKVM